LGQESEIKASTETLSTPKNITSSESNAATALKTGAYGLAFLCGILATLAVIFMLRRTNIQLSAEAFVSLVFTVALGAASLVLAIVAINYGRISERVMTERADRSIDIQMSLFQKSLDLQTQLFDKTMSTLESIGRSTGVTEQRLGDIHSLMQNPAALKQIAGRAVEQTTTELTKTVKEGAPKDSSESALAETLTKNIVKELSSRLEGIARPSDTARPSPAHRSPEVENLQQLAEQRDLRDKFNRFKKKMKSLREDALHSVHGAKLLSNDGEFPGTWDFIIEFKGKKSGNRFENGRNNGSFCP
jgi:hypothetical protein